MPRAVADVLLTIEYTALNSDEYRAQVLQRLGRTYRADRSFSLRHQFADAWYDLHNPDQTTTPMVVRFPTRREDFPPNVTDLEIEHVTHCPQIGSDGRIDIRHLHFTDVEERWRGRWSGNDGQWQRRYSSEYVDGAHREITC